MRSLRITIGLLSLLFVVVLAWLSVTQSGLRWAYQQVESYIPGELTITTLEGRLVGPIIVAGLEYQQDGTLIKADRVELEWSPSALLLANVDISRLHVKSLNIVLPSSEATDQPLILPELSLPFRVALSGLVIDDLNVSQDGQSTMLKQLRLNATSLLSQIDIEMFKIQTETFNLDIKGKLKTSQHYRHKLITQWQVTLPSTAIIAGRGEVNGSTEMTRITQNLKGALQLKLDAEVSDFLAQLKWQAKIDVAAFDIATLVTDAPALSGKLTLSGKGDLTTAAVSGRLNGLYPAVGAFDADFALQRQRDSRVQIDRLMLHAPINDTTLNARGEWQPGPDGGDVNLVLHWQNLRWPLKDEPWFDSAIGSGWLVGNINRYSIGLATNRPWPQAPPSAWYASAEGDLDGLNLQGLRVDTLDGEVNASGPLVWSPQLEWQAQVSAVNIDPATLVPQDVQSEQNSTSQWNGQLHALLTSRGRMENDQLVADVDITQLNGTLRGYPVTLRSHLNWRNDELTIHRFDFKSGSSKVNAYGRIGETVKLDWSINTPQLAELYPQAAGQFSATGNITGPRKTPMVVATFDGKALHLPNYEIGTINGAVAVDLFQWQQTDIKIMAQSLNLNGNVLQSLAVDANSHHLSANIVSDVATALIELKGELGEQGWKGRLEQADVRSRRFDDWQLNAPVMLNIGKTIFSADALCWHNNQAAKFCATLQQEDERWLSTLEMKEFPLMLFKPWLPADMTLDGVADATAKFQFQTPTTLLGEASIELPAGAVSYPLIEGERDRWAYRSGAMTLLLDEQGLQSESRFIMSNDDQLYIKAGLPGAKLLALNRQQQALQAEARMSVRDLGIVEALVPEVQDFQGELALNFSVVGTLAQPRVSGRAELLNGGLRIPRLGLTIDQLSLKSHSSGFEKVTYRIDVRSGDGTISVAGKTALDSAAGWPSEVTIKGNEFEVSRIPEARVLVSPDLRITMRKRTIEIVGDVHIPYAKLQPKDITTAARVSDDAVIIGGEQAKEEKWSIITSVRLTLGERVNFYGFGFEGRFGGSLLLQDEPGQLTRATGEITIPEGRYRAYGQRLDVEHGRLLYTGGPLTNPGIDLRAVRHVNNVAAGLKVRGSLNQPQIELFSIPAMGQTDTLAYIMLGHPIENASGEEGAMMAKAALALGLSGGDRLARSLGERFGLDEMRVESSDNGDQASLVMGRYLSPKLYISYGVGLIESFNTLSVRYQIAEQWQLKAESGEYQGADIFYTIER